jgi:hypothetical protein
MTSRNALKERHMRWSIAAAIVVISSGPACAITCPEGAYPWIGHRGVEYCRQDFIGPRDATPGRHKACPPGKKLATNSAGRQTCEPLRDARRPEDVRR